MVQPGKSPSLIIKLLNKLTWLSPSVEYHRLEQELDGCLEQQKPGGVVGGKAGGQRSVGWLQEEPRPCWGTWGCLSVQQQLLVHIPISGSGCCKGKSSLSGEMFEQLSGLHRNLTSVF